MRYFGSTCTRSRRISVSRRCRSASAAAALASVAVKLTHLRVAQTTATVRTTVTPAAIAWTASMRAGGAQGHNFGAQLGLHPRGRSAKSATLLGPRRLVWPRTSAFHADNVGSNPAGDTLISRVLA